nr:hypothetical protein [Tanacetum cinerariifolium]
GRYKADESLGSLAAVDPPTIQKAPPSWCHPLIWMRLKVLVHFIVCRHVADTIAFLGRSLIRKNDKYSLRVSAPVGYSSLNVIFSKVNSIPGFRKKYRLILKNDMPPRDKNLYVLFDILFDAKRYYKDGDCTRMLRRPRHSMTWRQFILALGLHTAEEMAKDGFGAYWLGSERVIPDKGDLSGLSVVTRELPLIDMGELVKLNICIEVGDDWAWVAQDMERQPVVAAASPGGAEDASDIDEERSMTDQGRFSIWMVSCMKQLMEASGILRHSMGPFEEVTQWSSRGVPDA